MIQPLSDSTSNRLVKETETLLATSMLAGIDHVGTDLKLADEAFLDEPLAFEEAIEFFKARVPVTRSEWNNLEPKVKFRAFTVASLSGPDVIDRVRGRMISLLEKGSTLDQFWNQEKLEGMAGIDPKNPFYWETVYRTNMQTAYNAGRALEFQRTKPEYLEFVGIEDERQTSVCAQRSGIILPADHPFWNTNFPPLHFNCRSTVRAVFKEEVEQLQAEKPDWKPTDPGNLPGNDNLKGFGENPYQAESFYRLTPGMVERISLLGLKDKLTDLALKLELVSDPIETIRLVNSGSAIGVGRISQSEQDGLITELKRFLKEDFTPFKIPVEALGETVAVTKEGFKKAVAYSADPRKVQVLKNLDEVFSQTQFDPTPQPPKDPRVHSESFTGRLVIDNGTNPQQYQVRVNRRKADGQLEFKDLESFILGYPANKRKPLR